MNNLFVLDPRLRRPNGTRQDPPPSHPSRGGNPYSDEMRRMVLQMHFNGVNLRNLPPEFADLRLNNKFPCHTTCRDWIRIFHEAGNVAEASKVRHVPGHTPCHNVSSSDDNDDDDDDDDGGGTTRTCRGDIDIVLLLPSPMYAR